MASSAKLCFVISPIGGDGTPERKHADQTLKHIIRPAAEHHGYTAMRADHIDRPGVITSQVIERLIEAPLVVADLTGHNPNVFYELALRHAVRRPLVQLIAASDPIPFDVSILRTIRFDLADPDSVEAAREALIRQIKEVEKDPTEVDNPISTAIDLTALKTSGKPSEVQLATVIEAISLLRTEILTVSVGVERLLSQSTHGLSSTFAGALAAMKAELQARSSEEGSSLREFIRAALAREAKPEK